jgi:5-methyltetrahydrofolate--homocysteine methyltransferase
MPVNFEKILREKILLFDGAMGTLLLQMGRRRRLPEEFLLEEPEVIYQIHRTYIEAGADVIESNSFSGNRLKLAQVGLEKKLARINTLAVKIARKAASGKGVLVAGSIGPTGHFLKPLGDLTFDEAYEIFAEQAQYLAEAGADLICLETFSDLAEARVALLAACEKTRLPVVVHLTYSKTGSTITGATPQAAAIILHSLGAAAVGLNCGFGPDLVLPLVEKLAQLRNEGFPFFISALPNAGKPKIVGEKAVYLLKPEMFAAGIKKIVVAGANLVGGCCGTTPAHIAAVRKILRGTKIPWFTTDKSGATWVASPSKVKKIYFAGYTTLIGDRINPTGRKNLVEDLKSGRFRLIGDELKKQADAGADILDVNVSHPEIDEEKILPRLIQETTGMISQPLSLDTSNPAALEAALKIYPGRPIINSTTGSADSLKKILPLARRFGAVLIGLAFDEKGIPQTASGRLKVARRIIQAAEKIGIARDDLLIDSLVMSLGTAGSAAATLDSLKLIKKTLKVKTILGIGNISYGLPGRPLINSHFLNLAIAAGMDVAIANPLSEELMKAFRLANYLAGHDKNGTEFLKNFQAAAPAEAKTKTSAWKKIYEAVLDGNKDRANDLTRILLAEGNSPYEVIEKGLLPAMEKVGQRFNKGVYFLPQLQASAEAVKTSVNICQKKMKKAAGGKGRVLLATVEGDIHDLGKNLVALIIGNNGYEVIDLGKNVPNKKILQATQRLKPRVVCLSALLTTTMIKMKELKKLFDENRLKVPLLVGGAVVTAGFARSIGAHYAADAVAAVRVVRSILKKKM